jgi:hypothetical protein
VLTPAGFHVADLTVVLWLLILWFLTNAVVRSRELLADATVAMLTDSGKIVRTFDEILLAPETGLCLGDTDSPGMILRIRSWLTDKAMFSKHATFWKVMAQHLLQQDPANKKIYTELKVGESSCTSDIVTVAPDGTRRAYEVTLSTGNCLSNAAKHARTDFVQIIFLCRDDRLREAVKACCREGGLDADLLAKLEFMQFSTLVSRQRRLSL